MANKQPRIDPKIIDELLSGQDPETVFSSQGLLGDLKKALAERMLDAEMDEHLDSEEERGAGNHRNGRSGKRVLGRKESFRHVCPSTCLPLSPSLLGAISS